MEYFIALCGLGIGHLHELPQTSFPALRAIYTDFSQGDAQRIKDIEKETNHDVKAVEYFIKGKLDDLALGAYKEYVHFGLTSQDINNTAIPLSVKDAVEQLLAPQIIQFKATLRSSAEAWKDLAMLARTHGQAASPTTLGKEIMVFVERIDNQMDHLHYIPFGAKFGGATGNFNAHVVAFPDIDWHTFANDFLRDALGLKRQQFTTQIEHYDNLAALFDLLKRVNNILIDLCRDSWTYISMDYFKQQIAANEVGSSAMPHKVNPIDFENAEGNLGIANAMLEHLSAKLPISRLQRDLTDSTVTRNIGVPFAHMLIALSSLKKGWSKLLLNEEAIQTDLASHCMVIAEGIQTVLRREGYPQPYEALKALTRTNEQVTMEKIHRFIDALEVDEVIKTELKRITPQNYTGAHQIN